MTTPGDRAGTAGGGVGTAAAAAPGERGTTTVADRAVRRIAERAAGEALGPGAVRVAHGSVSVRGRRAHVALDVALPYPVGLDDAGDRIQRRVAERTGELTGLTVTRTRIRIRGLDGTPYEPGARGLPSPRGHQDGGSVNAGADTGTGTDTGTAVPAARRPWAQRRTPMVLLLLAAAAACGLLLYDVVAVHAANRAATGWRTRLLDWLSGHGPGDAVVTGLAALIAVVGLWLLVLAVTPGHRRQLPLVTVEPGLRAVLDRPAVAVLVRDAVGDVPGVTECRTRVGRRRIRVRAQLGFGDRASAEQAVTAAASRVLDGLSLHRPLRLRVAVSAEAHADLTPDRPTEPPPPPEPRPGPGPTPMPELSGKGTDPDAPGA